MLARRSTCLFAAICAVMEFLVVAAPVVASFLGIIMIVVVPFSTSSSSVSLGKSSASSSLDSSSSTIPQTASQLSVQQPKLPMSITTTSASSLQALYLTGLSILIQKHTVNISLLLPTDEKVKLNFKITSHQLHFSNLFLVHNYTKCLIVDQERVFI